MGAMRMVAPAMGEGCSLEIESQGVLFAACNKALTLRH